MHLVQNHTALLNRRSAERREELEKERAELEIRRQEMRGRVGTAERAPASVEAVGTELVRTDPESETTQS